MKTNVTVFGTKSYDKDFLLEASADTDFTLHFIEAHLDKDTAKLAEGSEIVCAFVNDTLDAQCLQILHDIGVKGIALRCAGFNNVDLDAARSLGIRVLRVPAYSPHGVAEHTVGLILALNRKLYKAYNRVRENNFLLDGLLGFNLFNKTVGVVGTGKIGAAFCHIMLGFGCRVIAFDIEENEALSRLGVEYVDFNTLCETADIISLHCPLTPDTHHLIDEPAINKMKPGIMVINTSRGALIDTKAIITHLKTAHIGYLGLDVYEEEGDIFFEDISDKILEDDVFARLLTFPNVMITGHQAFFTVEALSNIAATTTENFKAIGTNTTSANEIV